MSYSSSDRNAISSYGRKLAASTPRNDPYIEVMSTINFNPSSLITEASTRTGGTVGVPNMTRSDLLFGQSVVTVRVGNRWAGIGTGGYMF